MKEYRAKRGNRTDSYWFGGRTVIMKQNKSQIFFPAESGLSSTGFSCSSLNRALYDRWSIVDVVSFCVCIIGKRWIFVYKEVCSNSHSILKARCTTHGSKCQRRTPSETSVDI